MTEQSNEAGTAEMTAATEKLVTEMTKNELAEYALAKHGVELDLQNKKDALVEQVQKLNAGAPPTTDSENPEQPTKTEPEQPTDIGGHAPLPAVEVPKGVQYVKHRENGHVFLATELLLKRGDMVPCDEKGNPVLAE